MILRTGVEFVYQMKLLSNHFMEGPPSPPHSTLLQLPGSRFKGWLPTFEQKGEGHANLPNYDYSKFVANPDNFLEDKFLDVGVYANAMELYKEDLVELRDQLKI